MKHTLRLTSMLLILALALMMCSGASAATVGETNALNMARELMAFMPLSYSSLVENLEYAGFDHAEAVYAADNCGADWNVNALNMARELMGFMPFSYSSLIENLENSGFSHDQAVYAADICFERNTAEPAPTETPAPVTAGSAGPAVPFAGDFSGYSFSELKVLQEALNDALWASEGWQQVTVPPGMYLVGRDIPAGHWTLTGTGNLLSGASSVELYEEMVDGGLASFLAYLPLNEPTNIVLSEGTYVEVEDRSVIFTPYVPGLGFVFE